MEEPGGMGRSRPAERQSARVRAEIQRCRLWCAGRSPGGSSMAALWRIVLLHLTPQPLCLPPPPYPDTGFWRTQFQNAKRTAEPSPGGEAHQQSDLPVRDLTGEGKVDRCELGPVSPPSAEVQEHPGEDGCPFC